MPPQVVDFSSLLAADYPWMWSGVLSTNWTEFVLGATCGGFTLINESDTDGVLLSGPRAGDPAQPVAPTAGGGVRQHRAPHPAGSIVEHTRAPAAGSIFAAGVIAGVPITLVLAGVTG